MARDCRTYQEKLSAFVDGRLSPKEAADVAAHLADCPDCAALVDQMKRLNEIASGALPEINPALLETLERRIQAEVDWLPTVDVSAPKGKALIFPIWYRYAAAAASIIIILAIGRQWYRESGLEIVPSQKAPQEMHMTRPPASVPSEALQMKPLEKDQVVPTRQKTAIPVPPVTTANVTTEPRPINPPAISGAKPETEAIKSQTGVPKPAEMEGIERGKADLSQSITVTAVPQETGAEQGEVTPSPVSETERAKAEPLQKKEAVPPVAAPPPEEKSYDKQIISMQDIERLTQGAATNQPRRDAKGERSSAQQAEPAGSLRLKYVEALSAYKVPRKYATGFQATPAAGDDSLARVEYVFQQASARPDTGATEDRATKLYLMAQAQYDRYRFTDDSRAYNRARELRDSLLGLLDAWLNEGNAPDYARGYKDEVERWRPQAIPATER